MNTELLLLSLGTVFFLNSTIAAVRTVLCKKEECFFMKKYHQTTLLVPFVFDVS